MAEEPTHSHYEELINFRVEGATVGDVLPKDWRATVARKKAFYVRGISWFRTEVESTVSQIDDVQGRIKDVVLREPRWKSRNFDFTRDYAANRQLYPAFRKEPLMFEKAISTILVLYSFCLDKGHGPDVLRRFSVEPAVSYIPTLNEDVLRRIEDHNPRYLPALAEATLQGSHDIFWRLAQGKGTVTHKLACRVRGAIDADVRDLEGIYIGSVEIQTDGSAAIYKTKSKKVSVAGETIDAEDDRVEEKRRDISEREGFPLSIPRVGDRPAPPSGAA